MFGRPGRSSKCIVSLCAVIAAAAVKKAMAEETESNAVGVSVAATLIGAISFIMCLYYFLNWPDEDIQKFSWELVSQTISIFCAVLLFQSFNDLVEAYIIGHFHLEADEQATMASAAVDLSHFLFWYICLQVTLCALSGNIRDPSGKTGMERLKFKVEALGEGTKEAEELAEKDKEGREVNLKCWAVLLAHLTGFASINAWGTVQHLPFFQSSPGKALLAVPMALLGQVLLQQITDHIRETIIAGDGEKDEYEKMWDDECEEAENDVMGLTLSFLLTNALRYGITNCFPNEEGKEEASGPGCVEGALYTHTSDEKIMLGLLGLVFAVLIFGSRVTLPEWLFEEEEEDSDDEAAEEKDENKEELFRCSHEEFQNQGFHNRLEEERNSRNLKRAGTGFTRMSGDWQERLLVEDRHGNELDFEKIRTDPNYITHHHFPIAVHLKEEKWEFVKRLVESLCTATSMSFSWCAFFGMQMVLAGYSTFQGESNAELSQVVLALLLSFLVFGMMIGLDKVADAGQAAPPGDWRRKGAAGVRNIMAACSLLVGFAWEQCFDQSVNSLADEAKPGGFLNPHTAKLLLSVCCASLLVPAWRAYMLPYILAKGWRNVLYLGHVFKAEHVGAVAHKIITHPDMDNKEKQEKRIRKMRQGLAAVSYFNTLTTDDDSKVLDYAKLAEDEVGALKQEVAKLRLENEKLKRDNAAYKKGLEVISAVQS